MILTLTLNPAIDLTIQTDRVNYDDRSPVLQEKEHPGGKGINAAQVIHSYGGQVHAVATRGGERGRRMAELLAASTLPVTLIPVEGETRRNFAISDEQGLTIKLDHAGCPLRPAELDRVEQTICRKLPQARWLMLTGSMPPETPPDFFARLIRAARAQDVSTLLDTGGDAFRLGLREGPTLAKPNRPEAERLLGRSLLSQPHSAAAASEIQRMGAGHVILSLGSQGAIAAWDGGLLRAVPPAVQSGCSIGAGDVLGATCVWSLSRDAEFPEALNWAVAAATVAASRPGLNFGPLSEVEEMRKLVEIRPI